MKNVLLFFLSIISFYTSFAIPPTPNEASLKVNAGSDVIVEATVSKKDTINVSETESYFLYTLDVVHLLKDRKAKLASPKTVQVLMKRDLEWEQADYDDGYNNPRYLRVGHRAVYFLKENITTIKGLNSDKPYYIQYSRFHQERIEFTSSANGEDEAYGFQLGFTTIQDMYQFIKSLPETSVPSNLTDSPQNKWWIKEPTVDSVMIKEREELIRIRAEYQKLHAPAKKIELEEKVKRAQKKRPNQRKSKVVTLKPQLSNPTFVYNANSTTNIVFDVLLSASENIYLDNFLMRLKYNSAAFGTNIAQKGSVKITTAPAFASSYYDDPNTSLNDQATDIINVPFGLKAYTANNITRTLVGTTPIKFLQISILISDCSQPANISFTDVNVAKILNFYTSTNPASYLAGVSIDATNYTGTINPAQLCKPNILTVTPTTVTAGTNSKITITGFGFGSTRGNGAVTFLNADELSVVRIKANDDVDVISWSDSKIEYLVSSNVKNGNNGTNGTGNITILENTGKESINSTDIIEVPYSISNFISNTRWVKLINLNFDIINRSVKDKFIDILYQC